MRIAGIVHESVTDGPGLRTTIFFQGCPHACPGCHNPQTWDMTGGEAVSFEALKNRLRLSPLLSGVTLSGGDPFAQAEAAAQVAAYGKAKGLNVWVYTGYRWEKLLKEMDRPGFRDLIQQADVLIDGPFQINHRDLNLPFRGSSNQRILRVQESLRAGQAIAWDPDPLF